MTASVTGSRFRACANMCSASWASLTLIDAGSKSMARIRIYVRAAAALLRSASLAIKPSMPLAPISCAKLLR
jgi:hypothetical protein